MSHKLGICIPYRNRKEHLDKLIPHLSVHLNKQGIEHSFYLGHQIDDKLFNRGAMKNIAAKTAFEDGCDYIAWHDVDMLPQENADYSYPTENPIHIATKLSKYDYTLGYDQYFGGVVLFTKEQVEATNGYSNDYWDWGMEDDDLFWRCHFEGMTTGNVFRKYENKKVGVFSGNKSFVEIPPNRRMVECLNKNHTISILVNAEQQLEKVPIWLIGDRNRQFIEYPIFIKSGGYNYMISFNNSRAYTMRLFDMARQPIHNYIKRFENMWTWVTMSVNIDKKEIYFYLNDELTKNQKGVKESLPYQYEMPSLMRYDLRNPFFIGYDNFTNVGFKGKIAEVKLHNEYYEPKQINDIIDNNIKDSLVFSYDFNDEQYRKENIETINEDINVIENIIPYRREGSFDCLPHFDEGFKNGRWVKGETTAKNEKRFVSEMQQRKINYKEDGMSNLKYELVNIETYADKCKLINVKL
jgi:hypothetical protein